MSEYVDNPSGIPVLNRIEKRAIEAQVLAPYIRAMIEQIGRDEALAIVRGVNEQEALARGKSAAAPPGEEIERLAADVTTWGDGGVLEMEELEKTATTYFFNVHRCPYYEKYKELGLEELGVVLSCCRDEPHARGLSPRLELERTQTIMEGAEYCDFRYRLSPG